MINNTDKAAEDNVCTLDNDGTTGGGEYHLNNSNEDAEPHISSSNSSTVANHCCKNKVLAVIAAVMLFVAVTTVVIVKNNQRLARHAQKCPNNVDRWVKYNGAWFRYSLYLHQWPNPDPKILILNGDVNYYGENKNPNTFAYGQGCNAGSWSVTYGNNADGSDFSLEYSVPSDDADQSRLRQQGGTFTIGGVEYDLKNNGSVFLMDFEENNNNNNQVTQQLSGLDLSSLVIDKETMSVASVTAFCYANQEILDFLDSTSAVTTIYYAGDDR